MSAPMPTIEWIERQIDAANQRIKATKDPEAIKRERMLVKMARIALQSRSDAIRWEIAFSCAVDGNAKHVSIC